MKTINLDSNRFGAATSFAISIQGSSTKTLKSKNFTLGISKDESYTQEILFSPNYKKDDPSTFVKLVLDATKNVDGKIDNKYRNINSYVKTNKELLANLDWTNKSRDYTVYMFKYLQQHPEVYNSLSAEQKLQWKELLRRYNGTDTIVEKNGGIIKAAKGTVLTGAGEDITSEASRYKGSKEKSKQKYDELRKRE